MNHNAGDTALNMDRNSNNQVLEKSTVNQVLFDLADQITQQLNKQSDHSKSLEERVHRALHSLPKL